MIDDARARQRRHRRTAASASLVAAALLGVGFAYLGGGGGSRSPGSPGLPSSVVQVAAKLRNLSGAPCTWTPTITGKPNRRLLSVLRVFRHGSTPPGVLEQLQPRFPGPFGEEIYANYVRRAGVFAGGPTYLLVFRDTGCSPIVATGQRRRLVRNWLGDNIGIYRPGTDAAGPGSLSGGVNTVESGGWAWLGAPGIKGLAKQSETVTLLVPDQVASVTIRYPAEAVEPAYHRHPGPIVPAITINEKASNNVVTFSVRHRNSAAMAPLTMVWRAANGDTIKTFHRL